MNPTDGVKGPSSTPAVSSQTKKQPVPQVSPKEAPEELKKDTFEHSVRLPEVGYPRPQVRVPLASGTSGTENIQEGVTESLPSRRGRDDDDDINGPQPSEKEIEQKGREIENERGATPEIGVGNNGQGDGDCLEFE